MRGMRTLRFVAALATVGGAMLAAPEAGAAGPYAIDAHVDGVAAGGNYTPSAFRWSDTFELSFTHTTDASTVALMNLQQNRVEIPTATVHQTLNGTAVITLAMSGVRVESVREDGNVNTASGPDETVVLRFKKVVYTYQAVTPTGQKLGAPVTLTFQRGDNH